MMEAGRKLDVLVAEKVMGWRHIAEDPKGYWAGRSPDSNPLSLLHHEVPYFSTDMNDAWTVVEHFGRKAASVDVSRRMRGYRCVIIWDGPNADARAESAPLAICLAGLRACGIEVPD